MLIILKILFRLRLHLEQQFLPFFRHALSIRVLFDHHRVPSAFLSLPPGLIRDLIADLYILRSLLRNGLFALTLFDHHRRKFPVLLLQGLVRLDVGLGVSVARLFLFLELRSRALREGLRWRVDFGRFDEEALFGLLFGEAFAVREFFGAVEPVVGGRVGVLVEVLEG